MKSYLPWFGFISFVLVSVLFLKWGFDSFEAKNREEIKVRETQRIEEEKEITKAEYNDLLIKSLKYSSFKFLVYDKGYDDEKISRKEYKELMHIFDRISMNDHINLWLQEKAHVDEPEGQ